ncbi:MAG: DUF1653 domain-containing protein [Bacilli bacterium]
MRKIEVGIYKHFKGNKYQVLFIGKDSETLKKVVVYQALYGENDIWIRDYEMFNSLVDKIKYPNAAQEYRFERIG